MPGAPVAHLAAGDLVVRATSPGENEMSLLGVAAHIDTDLGDDGLCGHDVDAIDLSQVSATDAV